MAITPLPALDRTSPTFKTDVDAFFGAQIPVFVTEANALQADVNAKQGTASEAATTATQKAEATALDAIATAADRVQTGQDRAATEADLAQTQLDRAATSQNAQATAADRVQTDLDRQATAALVASIADGPVTSVGGETGVVLLKTLNGSPLTGTGDITIDSSLYRSARTSNTELVAADKGKLIDITSGTFTQTFAAAASLVDGWYCYIKNSGTGEITLDPNASETIDALTSYIMYPGEVRLVQCDGTELRSIVVNAFSRTFTASGTFTKPPGYRMFGGLLWAGGGGGGRGDGTLIGCGGGGGACNPFTLNEATLPSQPAVTIGSGGSGGASSSSAGTQGGDSSVGSLVTVFGGGGGGPGGGGSGSGGGLISAGATGAGQGGEPRSSAFGHGGSGYGGGTGGTSIAPAGTIFGGGGGGGGAGVGVNPGGISVYGGSGGSGSGGTGNGSNGISPGGGGGAVLSGSATPGAGARGELRIWGII